jgi:acetyl esterase/lipase
VTCELQVREVSDALTWLFDHVHSHGGDAAAMTLFGHSAGAHLCAMALLHRAVACGLPEGTRRQAPLDDGSLCTHDGRMPRRAVLAAGAYDIAKHYEYEERRGVHMLSTMERALGGWSAFASHSPSVLVAGAVAHARTAPQPVQEAAPVPSPALQARRSALRNSFGGSRSRSTTPRAQSPVATLAAEPPGAATSCAERLEGDERAACAAEQRIGVQEDAAMEDWGWGDGRKRKRCSQAAEPHQALLDPPQRTRFYHSFELAGDAISARVGLSDHHTGDSSAQAGELACTSADAQTAVEAPMRGECPSERFAEALARETVERMPPIALMSGMHDSTVPWHESSEFFVALRSAGVAARHLLYDDIGHTEFVMSWRVERDAHGGLLASDAGAPLPSGPRFMQDLLKLVMGQVGI